MVDQTGIQETDFTLNSSLATDTRYYWRLYAENICGGLVSTQIFTFRTSPGPGDCGQGTQKEVIFLEDFESGLDGWQNPDHYGFKFDLTTVRAYSPTYAALASVPASTADQRLISPAIDIPSTAETVSLIFWHRWTFDSTTACNDGAILQATTNGGTSWFDIDESDLLTNPYNGKIRSGVINPIASKRAWCFGTDDWVRTVVQLSDFKGETVQFRFRLGSGNAGAAEGWYIDDVMVQSCVAQPQPYHLFLPSVLTGN